MSDEKEVKLVVPKSLMVVLWLIGGGLFAIGLQFLTVQSVSAQSPITKVAICHFKFPDVCADVLKTGIFHVLMARETASSLEKFVVMV